MYKLIGECDIIHITFINRYNYQDLQRRWKL